MDVRFKPLIETLKVSKITDQEYFSSKYSKYISNSRLGNINPEQGGSPEKFFGNMGKLYSDSLLLGSAVHEMVLQPEYFELIKTRRPTAKLGFVCDYLWDHASEASSALQLIYPASDEVDYYKGKLTDKIIQNVLESYQDYQTDRLEAKWDKDKEPMFLSEVTYDKAQACIKACNENAEFQSILHPQSLGEVISENELAFTMDLICDFPDRTPIIFKLKSKLDNFTIDLATNTITVNDLKTIGSILPKFDGPEGNFGKYHYHRELAMYLWLLKMYVEKTYNIVNPTMKVNCLVVSTIPDYYTKVYKVTTKEIAQGFNEFRTLLKLVAYYKGYKGYDFS